MTAAPPGTGRIAVVGASAAGLAAVETLRRTGWDGALTLVGDERHLPYDRPPLSKQVLSGAWEPERTALRSAEQLGTLDLDLRLGVRAERLTRAADGAGWRLALDDGTVLDCAGVVAATGVRARTLPGDGEADVEGVHLLRTLDDALGLRARLAGPGHRLVVVGTGVLGTEAAAVARESGHEVALVGPDAHPMARTLGEDTGRLLAEEHRRRGVALHTGSRVAAVLAERGRATGVRLDDGTTLPAETVLVAVGSEPATGWLDGEDGLDLADGIGCDAYCAAAPGLYAAGDVARWHHPVHGRALRVEHRMNATEQGMAAARNLLAELDGERFGARREFAPVPYFWSDQYALKIQAYGELAGDGAELLRLGEDPLRAVALHGRDGLATGVVGVGLPPRVTRALRGVVAAPLPWDEARGRVREVVG
ncbi:FAD-dependent oxidoreductase [Streptomyces sp. HNM0574]|uniref:NAD(P)/FAD-dependent oxidoreductase n=1 Tax=Streptomyces sp. HNM0574 TaxID=2714954 RepID=UPI001469F901|nr:FAD-dependent oxidoreductase [Streptomyces sp. HNM0574]NLU69149.1 FAD-dependent oxidoreductase [Streptomyces sp. HNM0574]